MAIASALVALLGGCGGDHDAGVAARVPRAAELVGTYDVRVTDRDDRRSTAGVGDVGLGATLSLALTRPAVALTGALRDDGTIALSGHTTQSDAAMFVDAAGKFEVRDGTIHFVGVLGTKVPSPLDLVMERPLDADLSSFAGRYRIGFDESPTGGAYPSTVTLDAAVDAGGFATAADADEVGTDGEVLARWSSVHARVAPSGRFQLDAVYAHADGSCPVLGGGPCLLIVDGTVPATTAGDAPADAVLLSGLRMRAWTGTVAITRMPR